MCAISCNFEEIYGKLACRLNFIARPLKTPSKERLGESRRKEHNFLMHAIERADVLLTPFFLMHAIESGRIEALES